MQERGLILFHHLLMNLIIKHLLFKYLPPLTLIIDYHDKYSSEVCLYDWIELIKNEINNKIIFRITFEQQTNDPRALYGYLNENAGKKIFQYLIDYNHKRVKKNNLKINFKHV